MRRRQTRTVERIPGRHPASLTNVAWRFQEVCSVVTIHITVVQQGEMSRLVVDGRLVGDDSAELLRVCGALPGPKTVELEGVRFVDKRAVGVLLDLRAQGIALVGASPYIRLMLGHPVTEGMGEGQG
jgi:hypothetical protein